MKPLALCVFAAAMASPVSYATIGPPAIGEADWAGAVLHGRMVRFSAQGPDAGLSIETTDGVVAADLELAVTLNGQSEPVQWTGVLAPGSTLSGSAEVEAAGKTVSVQVEALVDPWRDALVAKASAPFEIPGLRVRVAVHPRPPVQAPDVFVAGFGALHEGAETSGAVALIDSRPEPMGVVSSDGPMSIRRCENASHGSVPVSEIAVTRPVTSDRRLWTKVFIVVGSSPSQLWQPLFDLAGVPASEVTGRVRDTLGEESDVVGRDGLGVPQVWARAADDGQFALWAPTSAVQWSATHGFTNPRQMVPRPSGDATPVELDVAPKGGIRILVRDADTGQLLTARLIVRRVESAANGGPHATVPSGSPTRQVVQTFDALRGDVTAALVSGRYRIVATRGIEWSVDVRELEVLAGQADLVELSLRHVVPTQSIVSCDLHTHARPSFDSRNNPEETVVALVAAGIDFAVSTSHNIVSDYEGAAAALGLANEFSSLPAVEVTTYNPRFGHFGVFPATSAPPFEHTNLPSIVRAVRADGAAYFQLNHPRLPGAIGYFDTIGLDPRAVRVRLPERPDFDGIEVYNGFDIEHPSRVEEVLRDYWALLDQGWRYTATGGSDSHCLQYHCAVRILGQRLESGAGVGYPRTMVTVMPRAPAEHERDQTNLDPAAIVDSLKHGHATVTSGPVIDFMLEGAAPGDDLSIKVGVVHGHLRVRAAPWIDVSRVEIVVGRNGGDWQIVASYEVPERPTQWGPGPETLAQAQARAVRLDRDIAVDVGMTDGWVQAIASGTRRMSDVLPDVEVAPLAFTNPIYVRHLSPP